MSDTNLWWQGDEGKRHDDVLTHVRSIEEAQKIIHQKNLFNARLYGNCDLAGMSWTTGNRSYSRRPAPTVSENVVQGAIDTFVAKIASNQSRPTFQTDGADWSTQRKARNFERFIEAEFRRTEYYRKQRRAIRDACVFGLGALKFCDEFGKVHIERILPDDIIVDEIACRTSFPREMHQRIFIDREVLKALLPQWMKGKPDDEIKAAIEAATVAHQDEQSRQYTSFRRLDSQLVALVESWRLPSYPGADDGRHLLCFEGATVLDEQWKEDGFPFEFFWFTEPLTGFYGEGLAEKLTGHQIRINRQNRTIEMAQDRFAVPRVYVHIADAHLKSEMTNEVGQVVTYKVNPPTVESPRAISPELYQERDYTKRSAYETTGISALAATSRKPGGLDSGAALMAFHDRETERFATQVIDIEDLTLRSAKKVIAVAKVLYRGEYDHEAVWRGGSIIKRIKWSEVDPKEDVYTMSVEAASLTSLTPAGRFQQVTTWAQAGLISTDAAKRLMAHPDLEREVSLMTSALEYVEQWIEEALDSGPYIGPEPFENLDLGIVRRQQAALLAKQQKAPEEILQVFRDWIVQAEAIRSKAAAAQQMAAAPAPPQAAFAAQAMDLRSGGG